MHILSQPITSLAAALLLASTGATAQIVSSFDAGLEGWTAAGGTLSFAASGGNTGGFLKEVDSQSTYMSVSAPSKFFGDLSSYLGGTLSFDAKNISNSASDLLSPGPWFGTVTIVGAGGSATALLAGSIAGNPPRDGQWHTYSASLTTPLWSGDLSAALSNVTGISVQLEFNNAIVETAGFDNFRVSAVPEASTGALLALGLAGVALARRRRA